MNASNIFKFPTKVDPWLSDHIQFMRMLSEISSVGLTEEQMLWLGESMDLSPEQIKDLLSRADDAWDAYILLGGSLDYDGQITPKVDK